MATATNKNMMKYRRREEKSIDDKKLFFICTLWMRHLFDFVSFVIRFASVSADHIEHAIFVPSKNIVWKCVVSVAR